MNDHLPQDNGDIKNGRSDHDQVTLLQQQDNNSPSESPLFLYHGEHQNHSQQQLNPPTSHVHHDQHKHHNYHHQYESLASLLLQHQSFGIDGGDYENRDNQDDHDEKSWNQYSDNDSTTSNNNAIAPPSDGTRQRKSCRFFASSSLSGDSPRDIVMGMAGVLTMGILLGLIFPSSSSPDNSAWSTLSNILGFTYFVSWTCSFYPQIITNWHSPMEASSGVSLDFCVWNIVGFVCYAIYTTCFRFSTAVRMEYAHRFGGGENGNITNSTTSIYYDVSVDAENGIDLYGSDDDDDDDVVAVVPQVQINDVAFAWHALLLATITFLQLARLRGDGVGGGGNSGCGVQHRAYRSHSHNDFRPPRDDGNDWLDERVEVEEGDAAIVDDRGQFRNTRPKNVSTDDAFPKDTLQDWTKRISSVTKLLVLLLLVVCLVGAMCVSCHVTVWVGGEPSQWQWIDYLYFLSFIKVGISIVKYIPQVLLNYRRKSTKGWQIWNIILDFSGGTLSIIQLIGDSVAEAKAQELSHGSWTTGIVGNPAKFGLGFVSIFFDIIFMIQHYVLYRRSSFSANNWLRIHHDSERPLLHGGD